MPLIDVFEGKTLAALNLKVGNNVGTGNSQSRDKTEDWSKRIWRSYN